MKINAPASVENKISKLSDKQIRELMIKAIQKVTLSVRLSAEQKRLIQDGIRTANTFIKNGDWEKMNNSRKYLQWESQETNGYQKFALYAAEKMTSCGAPPQRLGNLVFSSSREDLEASAKLCLGYCCALIYGHYEEGQTHWFNPWAFCKRESVEKILSL